MTKKNRRAAASRIDIEHLVVGPSGLYVVDSKNWRAVKDECRVPVDGRLVVTRTRDGGQSFEILSEGLPTGRSYDLVYRHALAVDESGQRLAFGSTTGNLWASENGGDRWSPISSNLPPIAQVTFA